jgi:hypothetical protein
MFAIITHRKLLDILFFSFVVALLYYYSSHLSLPPISIPHRHRSHIHQHSTPAPSAKRHTRILHHEPPAGFTAFSRLYLSKGTLFAVVPDRQSKAAYPAVKYLISRPVPRGKQHDNEPTNEVSVMAGSVLAMFEACIFFFEGNAGVD